MREIKFRGKRELAKEWVYGDLTRYSEGLSYITVDLIEDEVYRVSTETVGQYTGLKDKNGVEIYEGDILLEKNCKVWGEYTKDDGITWLKMTNKTEDRLYQVFYDEKTCQFTTNRGWLWTLSNLTEVIGNIWEHPELIKGES